MHATPPASTTPSAAATPSAAHAFITRWQGSTASELSTAQSFVIELCDLLGVPRPHATDDKAHPFARPVPLPPD